MRGPPPRQTDAPASETPASTALRAERAAEAARLRSLGLLHRQIAQLMGLSKSYVSGLLLDPDGSEDRRRKASYGGVCAECGARTDGSNGRAKAPALCLSCHTRRMKESRFWTADAVTAAMRLWASEHDGQPPSAHEFAANREGRFPNLGSVYRSNSHASRGAPFASWADAVEAAGFARPKSGVRTAAGQGRSLRARLKYTPTGVAHVIALWSEDGVAPSADVISRTQGGFYWAALRFYGSWQAACGAAGVRARRATAPEADRLEATQ